MAIRLMLLDDHPLLVEGLEQLLLHEPDFEVVAKCRTIAEAERAIASAKPDLVILDLKLRDENGLDLLRTLDNRRSPNVIVLTASEETDDWIDAVRLGARGVVLKSMASTTLARAIRAVAAGRTWLTVDGINLGERLERREHVERKLAEQLTPREMEVLRELASGRENDAIAARLGLATGTVKLHVHRVYEKLGVSNRQDLMRYLAKRMY